MSHEQSYLSYFTPSQMSAEMLEAILVKRQNLAVRLVEKIIQSVLTPTKHQTLLLGPRGMGKSYLVALVYHRVKALPELADKIAIAYFAEEEWSISSMNDLLLVILKALEREYGGLQAKIDALYRLPIREIEGVASALVREFVGDCTLFLLVENLDDIFRGLGEQGQWTFRSFMSDHPFVTILATTPSLFSGVTDHDSAFYGFFQNIYLEELTVQEAVELLEKVAIRRDDTALVAFLKTRTAQERVQAVHDLAGGHPRIYLLFAHLLTHETLDELVTPFLKLLDELTPYYQSRMQLLSPQQRKIIEYLCSARGTVSVKEIAVQNLMTSQTASSQLDKLEGMAYVRKTSIGRESLYELREPLLRMVIEVKRGRGEPVRLIVDFLRRWYNRRERQERLAFASAQHPLTRAYLTAALDLKRAVQDAPNLECAQLFSTELEACYNAGEYARASELAAEIIERKGQACSVLDWAEYATCLYFTKQYKASLEMWNDIVELSPENVSSWACRAFVRERLDNFSGALEDYEKALTLDSENPIMWFFHGNALHTLGDYPAAIKSFNLALEIDPLRSATWHYLGRSQATLGDTPAAITSFDKAIELDSENDVLWFDRGLILYQPGSYLPARESFKRSIQIDPASAACWFLLAETQIALGDWPEGLLSLTSGFANSSADDHEWADECALCRLLFRNGNFHDTIPPFARLYAENGALGLLGQGITESIPIVLDEDTSISMAEKWREAWQEAQGQGAELEIPVRILAAAVEWKKIPTVRALLALPIEERRILESLLPKPDAQGAL